MLRKCSKLFQQGLLQPNFICKPTQITRTNLLNTKRHQVSPSLFKKTITSKKVFECPLHNVRLKYHNEFFTTNLVVLLLINSVRNIPKLFKTHSPKIVHNCVKNCKYVLGQRLRRTQQSVSLYSKLWDNITLKHCITRIISQLKKRRDKTFLFLNASLIYNWNKERIPDEDILR